MGYSRLTDGCIIISMDAPREGRMGYSRLTDGCIIISMDAPREGRMGYSINIALF